MSLGLPWCAPGAQVGVVQVAFLHALSWLESGTSGQSAPRSRHAPPDTMRPGAANRIHAPANWRPARPHGRVVASPGVRLLRRAGPAVGLRHARLLLTCVSRSVTWSSLLEPKYCVEDRSKPDQPSHCQQSVQRSDPTIYQPYPARRLLIVQSDLSQHRLGRYCYSNPQDHLFIPQLASNRL